MVDEGAASAMWVILHDLALLAQYAELLWLISQLNVLYIQLWNGTDNPSIWRTQQPGYPTVVVW